MNMTMHNIPSIYLLKAPTSLIAVKFQFPLF